MHTPLTFTAEEAVWLAWQTPPMITMRIPLAWLEERARTRYGAQFLDPCEEDFARWLDRHSAKDKKGRPLIPRQFKAFDVERFDKSSFKLREAYEFDDTNGGVVRVKLHKRGIRSDDPGEAFGAKSTFSHSVEYLALLVRKGLLVPEPVVPIVPEPAMVLRRRMRVLTIDGHKVIGVCIGGRLEVRSTCDLCRKLSSGSAEKYISDKDIWLPPHQSVYESSGGAAAKTQIPEEDFKPAEGPSESVRQFWEDKLNACEGILWQDLNGNMSGTREDLNRRTTQAPKQAELDDVMLEKFKQKNAGRTREQIAEELKSDPDAIYLLTIFGLSKEDAAERLEIKEDSVTKAKQRAKEAINQPVISQAIERSKPREAGWYIVLRIKSRPPYLVKLDMPETPTEDQEAFAIWSAKIEEENRLMRNKLEKLGRDLHQSNGDLTNAGVSALHKIRPKVHEAFENGMVFYLDAIEAALQRRGDRVVD